LFSVRRLAENEVAENETNDDDDAENEPKMMPN